MAKRQRTGPPRAIPIPVPWLHDDAYPLHRGSLEARISLDGLPAPRLAGAWAILATDAPGEETTDWALRAKGYQYWTRLSDDGALSLHKIRPGTYTLFISGADQFEDFQKHAITITAGQTTSLGDLHWHAITHGKTLWQIGHADRSPAEFHDGHQQDYRNYDAFLNYFRTFPHDVTFTIGQSTETRDWEFAQWSWYAEHPGWTIRFTCDPRDIPPKGTATLTIGIAASQRTTLTAALNGKTLAARRLPRSGTAAYRSGAQDSLYTIESIPFDAALLKPGPNELTLTQSGMKKFSPELLAQEKRPRTAIMFDALRLEVQPAP